MKKISALVLVLALLLAGCAADPVSGKAASDRVYLNLPEDVPIPKNPIAQEAEVLATEPAMAYDTAVSAPGSLVERNEAAEIDYSNTADGYVMVRYFAETSQRLKAQVKGPATTYTFNLTQGQWAAFPLADENGSYKITVYENVSGSKYAAVLSHTVEVTLSDPFAPFLHANQYVDIENAPNSVAKAMEICAGLEPLQKVEAVYDFVVKGMVYDYALAETVKSGYLPVLDDVLARMSGICFDYAALMTGMLRSQGVPCKLVVGYAGSIYHAWISVWTEETGWVEGIVFFDGESWQRMDPTFASSGGDEITDYITNDGNYAAKYIY